MVGSLRFVVLTADYRREYDACNAFVGQTRFRNQFQCRYSCFMFLLEFVNEKCVDENGKVVTTKILGYVCRTCRITNIFLVEFLLKHL